MCLCFFLFLSSLIYFNTDKKSQDIINVKFFLFVRIIRDICIRANLNSLRLNYARVRQHWLWDELLAVISTQSSEQGQTHCRRQYSPSAVLNIALQGLRWEPSSPGVNQIQHYHQRRSTHHYSATQAFWLKWTKIKRSNVWSVEQEGNLCKDKAHLSVITVWL